MNKLILESQNAFVPCRLIQDNVIIAHELFNYLMHKKRGVCSSMALKLDLAKAYDKVDWDFLQAILLKMGFDRNGVNGLWSVCLMFRIKF